MKKRRGNRGTHGRGTDGRRQVVRYQRPLRLESLEPKRMLSITVNTLVDENNGIGVGGISLRDAIAAAAPGDTITFAPSLTSGGPATITLTHGSLPITKSLTVTGPGASLLTIDASGNDPTPDQKNADGTDVFDIGDSDFDHLMPVTISGLTIAGADASGTGLAAVFSREDLTLSACTITRSSLGIGSFGNLSVVDSTITGNGSMAVSQSNGGIYSKGSATISNSTISNNSGFNPGEGILIYGTATITGCTIAGNTTTNGGGAICSVGQGPITIENCTIRQNTGDYGGAINATGMVTITNTTISQNTATTGGAIYALGEIDILDSTLSGNTASKGGAIDSAGRVTLSNSTVSSNTATTTGGGIFASTSLTINNSKLTQNSANSGGGIYARGPTSINNSTITGNSATTRGAGIYEHGGSLTVNYSTIDSNHGSGISVRSNGSGTTVNIVQTTISNNSGTTGGALELFQVDASIAFSTIVKNTASDYGGGISLVGGTLSMAGTILAANTSTFGPDLARLFNTPITANYNLIGNNQDSGFVEAPVGSPDANGNLVGGSVHGVIDPKLGPLASNGGRTQTYSLLTGSPAIDAGDPAAVAGADNVPFNDQRGTSFARVYNGRIDIGAFERQLLTINLVVDTLGDVDDGDYSPGHLSLREAINIADGFGAWDDTTTRTISFSPSLFSGGPATILLSHGELVISRGMSIAGPGAGTLTIDGSGNDFTPLQKQGDGKRVFDIDDGNTTFVSVVSLTGMTITGGDANISSPGGGIFSKESLTVTNSVITGNASASGSNGGGGGIYSSGALTVRDSTISQNIAINLEGGGIRERFGALVIERTVVTNNKASFAGGGLSAADGAVVQITSSTFSNNQSTGGSFGGGGLFTFNTTFTMTGSTVTGNQAYNGGGLYARLATVHIDNSVISGNVSKANGFGPAGGGGINQNGGSLVITNSTISGNSVAAPATAGGGGINQYQGTLSISGTTITSNTAMRGAAINVSRLTGTTSQISGSTISGNTASLLGGGIYLFTNGSLTISSSAISNNHVTTAATSKGGGVAVVGAAVLTINSSTIDSNGAALGAGVFTSSTQPLLINDSTLSGNSATTFGGGLYNFTGTTTIRRSTITANSALGAGTTTGAGVFSRGISSVSTIFQSSIVAGNSNNDLSFSSTFNSLHSMGYNLAGTGNGNVVFTQPGDVSGVTDPKLAPLADNGGPTKTHALMTGSPAIDAGDPAAVAGSGIVPLNDERGAPFSRVVGGRIDIGALERQPINATAIGDYNQNGVVDMADYALWRNTQGTTVPSYTAADGNGNGVIDAGDYSLWRSHFGTTVPAAGAGSNAALVAAIEIAADVAPPLAASALDDTSFSNDQAPTGASNVSFARAGLKMGDHAAPDVRSRALRYLTATSSADDGDLTAWVDSLEVTRRLNERKFDAFVGASNEPVNCENSFEAIDTALGELTNAAQV